MEITIIQAILVFVVAFIMGIDQFSFLESLYQPIVLARSSVPSSATLSSA